MSIRTDIDALTLSIDGGETLTDPSAIGPLAAGKHSLYLSADGYHSAARDVFIDDGTTTKLQAELVELPGAWYGKWWVWAIVGGVAAAATTTAIIFAPDAPDSGFADIMIRPQP